MYLGHRRFLGPKHALRKRDKHFNAKTDPKPAERTCADVFNTVPKVHCKTLKTIGFHKVYHITTANQLLVECESSITSPTDMGKPTLTIVDQSLTGAVKIQKKIQKM